MTEPTPKHREEAREVFRGWTRTGVTFRAFHPNGVDKMRADLEDDIVSRIATALSSRDREIREVLEGLRCTTHPDCWCAPVKPQGSQQGIHSPACLAARGLWERVRG